jgi:hypothetical protein
MTNSLSPIYRTDPLDVIYGINPELPSRILVRRDELLTPEILPNLVPLRGYQYNEIPGELSRYCIERASDVAINQSNNHVRINRDSENNRTKRAKIGADVRKYEVDGNVKMNETSEVQNTFRTMLTERGLTERTCAEQNGLTERAEIESNGLFALNKLKYEVRARIVNMRVKGLMHISDNILKAVYAQAEAYKNAAIETEKIRADAKRGISKDKLEARLKESQMKFSEKMLKAENYLKREEHKDRTEIAKLYIESQTQIYMETLRKAFEFGRLKSKLEKERLKHERIMYKTGQRTVQKALDVLEKTVPKDRRNSKIEIKEDSGLTIIEFSSEI